MASSLDPRNIPASLRWVLSILIVCGALSLLESPYPMAGVQDLLFILFLSGAFLLGAELSSLDDIMKGLAVGLAVTTAVLLAQSAGLIVLSHDSGLPAGLFFNSEVMAEFSALVCVWALVSKRWIFTLIAAIPVVLAESRIGGLVIIMAVFYAYRPASWKTNALIGLAILALAVATLQILGPEKIGSASHRIVLWGTGIGAWRVIGQGLGWGSAAFPYEQFIHSDAIQAITELGIVAVALISIPFIAFRNGRGSNAERAVFVAACVEVVLSFPLHFPATGFVAAIVAGYLVSARPVVRMGNALSGTENGFRGEWRDAAYDFNYIGGGRGNTKVSIRPIFSQSKQVHP